MGWVAVIGHKNLGTTTDVGKGERGGLSPGNHLVTENGRRGFKWVNVPTPMCLIHLRSALRKERRKERRERKEGKEGRKGSEM